MSRIRGKDTKPETMVRRSLHRLGYRYSVHGQGLPGKPDLVFTNRKKVVFVHGCFWHNHKRRSCKISHIPKSRIEYWKDKFEKTRKRDKANIDKLEALGWSTIVVWECELAKDEFYIQKLTEFLGPPKY